ncbi:TrmB family transcriptional regulator [Halonotius terrestris]|uniref:TrmB family transcriptional regulator n=1 Tax=Halonotius terrestris TaxID=2487750 RepID=A0A8J8PC89_9EURY|nr:TrmB family transcriptional regulator sugar-binding domain-containing protein [Halonotius terrestris]TQQ83719.1 TrmB family transcriptional regulator [Halonotius terrestris]
MDDATLRAHLQRFGFSEKEVDTYLTLLAHGAAKASTIADDAGVSKRYVYSVSEELADRGFVEVDDHVVPTMIRARPPEEVVDHLITDAETIRPALENRHTKTEQATEQFEVIKSRETVLKRITELIEHSESELTLSLPADRLSAVADELRAALDRGVLVMLLITETDELPASAEGLASITRIWREPMPAMLTADDRVGLVAPAEMLTSSHTETQAIVFAHPQLGPVIVGSFVGNYWPVATEVAVGDPAALPLTETDFRKAVIEATLWLRTEGSLNARIEGRWIDTSEPVSFEGRIVDTTQGIVEPTNSQFPIEASLTVDHEGTHVTVGGEGAFIEDIEAERVTLCNDS